MPISKIISRYTKSISNCCVVSTFVNRLYVYDNSEDYKEAKLLFRASDGKLEKIYNEVNPWATPILESIEI